MKTKKVLATILMATILLTSTSCKSQSKNISVSISDVMNQFDDDTLFDEVLEESKKISGIETGLIDDTIKLEEYIKLIDQISKLNIPTPKEITEDTINEFSKMTLDQIYCQIEKQQVVVGTGAETIARESGLYYLQEQYGTWIKKNGIQIATGLLRKAFETAALTASDIESSHYSQFSIEERTSYTNNEPSIYIDLNDLNKNQTTTYVVSSKSKALSTLATSYYELDQLAKDENATYEQIAQSCSRALDAVKIFIAAGVSLDDNILASDKTTSEAKRLILEK